MAGSYQMRPANWYSDWEREQEAHEDRLAEVTREKSDSPQDKSASSGLRRMRVDIHSSGDGAGAGTGSQSIDKEERMAIDNFKSGLRNVEPMLQLFAYDHLPEHLQAISKPFGELAIKLVEAIPRNSQRTMALQKMVEAKDCAVRAALWN